MKKGTGWIIVIILIAALALIKIFFLAPENKGPGGPDKGGKGMPSPVSVTVVHPEETDNRLFVTGNVLASEEITLVAETQGKVSAVYFTEGSAVSKGQLLVKLNDDELQAASKKLKANEKILSEKEARQKKLLAINGISQEEYDNTVAQLNSIRADIEMNAAQIAKTEIKAPFSGTIGLSDLAIGSYISPNTPISILQQNNPVKIDFCIPEKYAGRIKKGDTISFIPGNGDKSFAAKISAIQPKADASTHTVQIRALCNNPEGKIFPGVFARVEFNTAAKEKSMLAPTEAIVPFLKGQKIYVVKNGMAEEVVVQTGFRSANKVQILNGLNDGDSLIVSGLMALKKGAPVKVVGGKKNNSGK